MTGEGEVSRFGDIYEDHVDAVLSYALARTDQASALDVVSDTFAVVWRRLDEVPEQPRGWLLAVARKVMAGHRRTRRRYGRLADRVAREDVGTGASAGLDEVVGERLTVLAALQRLRPADREILCLVAWDGLDPSEAAEVLGCSPGTFAVRLHRARGRLEDALENEELATEGDSVEDLAAHRAASDDAGGGDEDGGTCHGK